MKKSVYMVLCVLRDFERCDYLSEVKTVFAEERKEQILKLLSENDKVYVPKLSEIFKVSAATIRNDLNELEKIGKLIRTHGGAISSETSGIELSADQKKTKNISNKTRIAEKSMEFVQDGDIILLDTGTTTAEIAKLLTARRNVTVITNDLEIALQLEGHTGLNVIIIGGSVRPGFHCTVGMFANNLLDEITVDKAFIATNSLDIETGLYTPDTNQAEIKNRMIKCAREAFLVCDNTKIGRKSFAKFAELDDFHIVITDSELDAESYSKMSAKVEVIRA